MAIFTILSFVLGAAGFTGPLTIFGLSAQASAAVIGISRAVFFNAASRAFAPKAARPQVQGIINQGISPRIRAYGQVKLGGVRAFFEAKSGTLYQLIVCHHGPLSGVLGWEVDGAAVTTDGMGNVLTEPFVGFLDINVAISAGNGGDWALLRAEFPTLWTTDHDIAGQATYLVQMKAPPLARFQKVFPKQDQTQVRIIAQASAVYDPRNGVTAYSDNAGLCIRDYLTSVNGLRMLPELIDDASFGAFATLCGQAVALKAGGTEPRYRLMGYYTLEDAPKEVMGRMLQTCDGQLYPTIDGKVGILGGAWSESDVTLSGDDILDMTITSGTDPFTDFNVLKGIYTDPANGYQPTACAELRDEVALLTEPFRVETFEADMVPSHTQMQRLMWIERGKMLRRFTAMITTNLVGLKARYPKGDGVHTVRIRFDELGIDGPFEVLSHSFSIEARTCTMEIASLDNMYVWIAAVQEGPAPAVISGILVPADVVSVPFITLSQQVIVVDQATRGAEIVAQANDPGNASLQLVVEFKLVTALVWQTMLTGPGDLRAYSKIVADGSVYQIRAKWSVFETYSAVQTITTVANPTAPAVPTVFTGSESSGTVTLNWTNGGAGYFRTRVYRSATADFNDGALIATVTGVASQPSSYSENPGTGTWRYWVVTINASSIESAPVGPQTFTI